MSAFDPSVVEKVKKILARAQSAEPHEAAIALEMAARMMAEHGLTAEQVEIGEISSEALRSVATVSRCKPWELRLYAGVADALGCGLMFRRGDRWATDSRVYAHYLFVGPKAEAQISQYAAHVLQRQALKAKTRFNETLPSWWSRAQKTGEVDAYCEGWVATALSKVTPLAPNPRRSAAIAKHIEERSGGSTRCQPGARGSEDSRDRGLRDGRDAELRRPMEGDERAALGSGRLGLPSGKGDET